MFTTCSDFIIFFYFSSEIYFHKIAETLIIKLFWLFWKERRNIFGVLLLVYLEYSKYCYYLIPQIIRVNVLTKGIYGWTVILTFLTKFAEQNMIKHLRLNYLISSFAIISRIKMWIEILISHYFYPKLMWFEIIFQIRK